MQLMRMFFVLTSFICATSASAQVITFETTPSGGTPVDNALLGLGDGYTIGPLTLTFGFDLDGDGTAETPAAFEQTGDQALADGDHGFHTCEQVNGQWDIPWPGFEAQLGQYFLRTDPGVAGNFGKFVIDYAGGTVTAASGEIWDIDSVSGGTRTERYLVTAWDSGGGVLATQESPVGDQDDGCANAQLDARPWTFSFSGLSAGIARITIEFTGTKINGIGMAFNNFDATGAGPPIAVQPATWGQVKATYR